MGFALIPLGCHLHRFFTSLSFLFDATLSHRDPTSSLIRSRKRKLTTTGRRERPAGQKGTERAPGGNFIRDLSRQPGRAHARTITGSQGLPKGEVTLPNLRYPNSCNVYMCGPGYKFQPNDMCISQNHYPVPLLDRDLSNCHLFPEK